MRDPLSSLDEYALIERAQAGDRAAAGTLILRHQPFVRKVAGQAMRYGRGRVDIEDLIQDGMLFLLEKLPLFDSSHGCKFLSFAARFLWARLYDRASMAGVVTGPAIRTNKGRIGVLSRADRIAEEIALAEVPVPDDRLDCEAAIDTADALEELHRKLARLSDREQTVLLRRAAGEAFRPIAETFGVTKTRIAQIERAALHKLRNLYQIAEPP